MALERRPWPTSIVLPATPAFPFRSSTPSLDADQLDKLLLEASNTVLNQSGSTHDEDAPSVDIYESAALPENKYCQTSLDSQVQTPPNSPHIATLEPITMGQLKGLFEAVLGQKSRSTLEGPAGPADSEQSGEKDNKKDNKRVRTSKMDYKTFNEIWDEKAYDYKIVNSIPTPDVSELDEYIFVVRKHVAYDLLWAWFKPGTLAFMKCPSTGLPRCVQYSFGWETQTAHKVDCFEIHGHYLDFDGEVFGKSTKTAQIEVFQGVRRIESLSVYLLEYHPDPVIRSRPVSNGQKFNSLMGCHHRQYQGNMFVSNKGQLMKLHINSRVMIDARLFRKTNLNYARLEMRAPQEHLVVLTRGPAMTSECYLIKTFAVYVP
ncbi:hypothetical protein VTN00DRAFT_9614 [Thermoascus crustaceus]|uniref:uncharacterized protein n=1 Tax=Thermoascus crustaceus TaxID=5088 RepID=UPI0037426CF0